MKSEKQVEDRLEDLEEERKKLIEKYKKQYDNYCYGCSLLSTKELDFIYIRIELLNWVLGWSG